MLAALETPGAEPEPIGVTIAGREVVVSGTPEGGLRLTVELPRH